MHSLRSKVQLEGRYASSMPSRSIPGAPQRSSLVCANLVCQGFRAQKKEWEKFAEYVQNVVASVIGGLGRSDIPREDLERKLINLKM